MKTYTFKVVLEKDKWPDEPDEKAVWRAYIPMLESKGAATWGYTKEEAIKNIQDVTQMVIESMIEHHEPIPTAPQEEIHVFDSPLVAVTV
ncbi:type II toxin-antitoxin system HicB family antitoxin [Candidatus Poribacteria bacterium]|nr:type II toxin-antitoxin system HicB family antitoxin [Candidatus Poribacteria bacterium]